jgi:hypothetical protein
MLLFAILVIIPAFVAFKRGHNGYVMIAIASAEFLAAYAVGWLADSWPIFLMVFFTGWAALIAYCLLVDGSQGNQLEIACRQPGYEPDAMPEEMAVAGDDYVLLKSYAESWRQGELMEDLQKLQDARIHYQSHSGLLATIMVRERDHGAAAEILGLGA